MRLTSQIAIIIFFFVNLSFGSEPLVKGVAVTYIHSSNKQELTKWYQEKFSLKPSWASDDWTQFSLPDGSAFALDQRYYPVSMTQKQDVTFSFEVSDIKKAVSELSKRGVPFYPSTKDAVFDVGSSYVATFVDPDGNFVQLSQRK